MPIRKKESNVPKILFSALIGLLLIASVFWFALSFSLSEDSSLEYGEIEFFRTQTGLAAEIEGEIFQFTYIPESVSYLNTSGASELLVSSPVSYMTSHPDDSFRELISLTIFDASRALQKKHGHSTLTAFTVENTYNLPVITCLNATPLVPVVLFNLTNSTSSVSVTDSCAVINFDSEDSLQRIHDRLVYELLGVAQ